MHKYPLVFRAQDETYEDYSGQSCRIIGPALPVGQREYGTVIVEFCNGFVIECGLEELDYHPSHIPKGYGYSKPGGEVTHEK